MLTVIDRLAARPFVRLWFGRLLMLAQIGLVFLVVAMSGYMLGTGRETMLVQLFFLFLGLIGAGVVWFYPYIGLVIIVASVPLEGLLKTIPYGTVLTQMLGALALVAFVYQRNRRNLFSYGLQLTMVLAGLFAVWQFVRYPEASFYGSRNWTFTYAQLFFMLWLASELLTPQRQRVLMYVFLVAAVASALSAFSQSNIVADFSSGSGLERGSGLAENQNSLAFMLVLAFAMNAYLHSVNTHPLLAALHPPAYVALVLGVVGTVSRSGFISLSLALLMTTVFWLRGGPGRASNAILLILVLLLAVLFIVPDDYWAVLENTLFTADVVSEGNLGKRQTLIEVGIEMWTDHPVIGVGIDQFQWQSWPYLVERGQWNLAGQVQHNFYVALLAETGLIGFMLYLGWMAAAMFQLGVVARANHETLSPLAMLWLIVFVLFLVRGFTASTMHYNKLLFMMGGMSIYMYQRLFAERRERHRWAVQESEPLSERAATRASYGY